jgi:hypothetical protein
MIWIEISHSIVWLLRGLYCPPVIPAELAQSSAEFRWFSDIMYPYEVGRLVMAELGRTRACPEEWNFTSAGLDQATFYKEDKMKECCKLDNSIQ